MFPTGLVGLEAQLWLFMVAMIRPGASIVRSLRTLPVFKVEAGSNSRTCASILNLFNRNLRDLKKLQRI